MTRIIGIDPGYIESAYCVYDGVAPLYLTKVRNETLIELLPQHAGGTLVVEQVKNYGMPAGDELFDTVWWSGRFAQVWESIGRTAERITRKAVVGHICNSGRATDANVRQALIDRYGGRAAAIGTKKKPGVLYGISGDEWSALAIAITWHETGTPSRRNGDE